MMLNLDNELWYSHSQIHPLFLQFAKDLDGKDIIDNEALSTQHMKGITKYLETYHMALYTGKYMSILFSFNNGENICQLSVDGEKAETYVNVSIWEGSDIKQRKDSDIIIDFYARSYTRQAGTLRKYATFLEQVLKWINAYPQNMSKTQMQSYPKYKGLMIENGYEVLFDSKPYIGTPIPKNPIYRKTSYYDYYLNKFRIKDCEILTDEGFLTYKQKRTRKR